MKIINNKKGMNIQNYLLGLLFFSMIVGAFFLVISDTNSGLWYQYGYTVPTNNLSNLDKTTSLKNIGVDIACDINPETNTEECTEVKKSPVEKISEFINGMVQGGYAGIVTIYKSFDTTKSMVEGVGTELNIPPPFVTGFQVALLLALVITIVFIIFNRSDTI